MKSRELGEETREKEIGKFEEVRIEQELIFFEFIRYWKYEMMFIND